MFSVTEVLDSPLHSGETVGINYLRNGTPAEAITSVGQILTHCKDDSPFAPTLRAITITNNESDSDRDMTVNAMDFHDLTVIDRVSSWLKDASGFYYGGTSPFKSFTLNF